MEIESQLNIKNRESKESDPIDLQSKKEGQEIHANKLDGHIITFDDIKETLEEFNNTHEDEHSTDTFSIGKDSKKLEILQDKLDELFGEGELDIYDANKHGFNLKEGEDNRKEYLCHDGKPLKPEDYPGSILPTSC